MDNINFKDLARYRLEMAESKISVAELLIKQGMYADAVSRIYYGMFHAAFKKRNYVYTGNKETHSRNT